jgi:hypothetical protein
VQLLDYAQDQIGRGGLATQRETEADSPRPVGRDQDEPSALGEETGTSTSAVYSEPEDPRWQEAWQVTEQLIRQTRDEVIATGAQFLVVLVSTSAQVHPDPEARQAFAYHKGVPDLLYSNRRIGELGLRSEIAVLDLVPAMRNFAERTGQCLHGFDNTTPCAGHWNVTGHLAAGTLIARHMCENLASSGQEE